MMVPVVDTGHDASSRTRELFTRKIIEAWEMSQKE
jgi:hypothetical protein